MNSNLFFTSDLHFDHEALTTTFVNSDGSKCRNFNTVDETDEYIISKWNSVVKPNDKVIIVGDVAFRNGLPKVKRLNGRIFLVKGNHDNYKKWDYSEYFEEIYGAYTHGQTIVTHIPVHPSQLEYRFKLNIHGHLHANRVLHSDGSIDERYFNVSVELHDYTPVEYSEIAKFIK